MVHAYHMILSAYGFWLPNDPRGSWSEFVGKWELVRFGRATYGQEFRHLMELTPREIAQRKRARASLKYPPIQFTGMQAKEIVQGFATACERFGYVIWACSILPEHTHLVLRRHRYKAESVANKLKAATSQALIDAGLHPLIDYAEPDQRPPRMWSENQWIAFLDSETGIENAIGYVIENPEKEGKRRQQWPFVTPFPGLDGAYTTYH